MILTMMLPPSGDIAKLSLARQMGITHAITKAAPDISRLSPPYDFCALKTINERFAAAGMKLLALKGTNLICRP